MTDDERIKEACGVFGIFNPHGEDAAPFVYYGLSSCSIAGRNPAESPCSIQADPGATCACTGVWAW